MPFVHLRAVSACLLMLISMDLAAQSEATSVDRIDSGTVPGNTLRLVGDITLREAIRATLTHNPDLSAFAYELRANDARTLAARQRPPLELRAEVENFGGTGASSALRAAETTLALSRVTELGSKRSRRIELSEMTGEGLSIERQAMQLDRLAEVTRRFVHVASDQQQLALAEEALQLANETVRAVRHRVDVAKSPEAELHRAQLEHLRAEIEFEHAEHELESSKVKLAAMWGEIDPAFNAVVGDLHALPTLDAFDDLIEDIEANPDFLRLASLARLREAELRVAQAQRRADVAVTAGVRRLAATDDAAFVVGISMPFGASARAAPAISEARTRIEHVAAQRAAALVTARAQLFEIHQELRHAITEARILKDRALPKMQTALEQTQYAYERGRYGYVELAEAQRAFIDIKRALIAAAANAHVLQAELERLTARPADDATNGSTR